MKALGAYIFAGGFTLGVSKRFDVLAHFEGSDYGVATARLNFPKLPVHFPREKWPVDDPRYSELDFLYGNPPCAAWSVAGYTKTKGTDKWRTDPRVECTVAHFGLMRELRPKVWAWESVTQAYSKGEEFVRSIERDALDLGYSVTYLLHDAQWLGLPQVRRRFFMVCHRIEFNPGAPNWAPPDTCWDVLKSIKPGPIVHRPKQGDQFDGHLHEVRRGERLSAAWERVIRPPGEDVLNARGQVKNRPSFGHCRLDPDKTANAVVGYMMIHPTEDRWMSTNELQALSGFPQDWKWAPKKPGDIASEMARGVCPTVGEWLAREVAKAVETGRPVEAPSVTEVNLLKPPGHVLDLEPGRPLSRGSVGGAHISPSEEQVVNEPVVETLPNDVEPPPHVGLEDFLEGYLTRTGTSRKIVAMAVLSWLQRASPQAGEAAPPEPTPAAEAPGDGNSEASSTAHRSIPGERRTKRTARAPATVANHDEPVPLHSKPLDGEGSGAYIRRLLMRDQDAPEEIVNLVLRSYEKRKTQVKDVYWNYRKLVEDGARPPPWRGTGKVMVYDSKAKNVKGSASKPKAKRTLLLTGCTAMQVGSEKTQLKIITAMASWRAAFAEMGYEVDWRPIKPGEDVSEYDAVVVGMNKPNVRTATHFYGCLWALAQRKDAVIAIDDWQTADIDAGIKSFARSRERAFRLERASQTDVDAHEDELFAQLELMASAPWTFPAIVPVFTGGDVKLLEVPAKTLIGIDPSIYAKRYAVVELERERVWVRASLLAKKPPSGLSWPVKLFGNPDKEGGHGKSGPDAQPRVTEPELMNVYCGVRGVISPSHPHAGSGWWRVRYLMASDAGCILSADPKEAAVIGAPYAEAADPASVEKLSDRALDELAMEQTDCLSRKIEPKAAVMDKLTLALRRAGPRPPKGFTSVRGGPKLLGSYREPLEP